ncbi:MAG: type I-C CRISPR-associated protein Cas8c/Csd1 [Magnetococcales bacterium]|nr:type I-C CRISPR-associated protein Cas8c/Csd1 [Magnetococcales bacterium]
MILQSLYHLYDRLAREPEYGVAEPGFSQQKLTFSVILTEDGTLNSIQDEREEITIPLKNGKSKQAMTAKPRIVPGQAKPSGSGIHPGFLWNNATYLLGYDTKDKPERTRACFAAFRKHHLELEQQIADPGFSAVCRFLESWSPERGVDFPHLAELNTGFGVFRLQGALEYVHDRPIIQAWWRRNLPGSVPEEGDKENVRGMCLISGLPDQSMARLHEPKIKGVHGTQSAGAPLVSFNDETFTSYAKEQSFNAPVSQHAAFRYCTAINALLDGPRKGRHRFSLAGDTVALWTGQKTVSEDLLAGFFTDGAGGNRQDDAQDVETLRHMEGFLMALRHGSGNLNVIGDDPMTPFYLLGLSPNAGRMSVRFWNVSTLGSFIECLRDHYSALKIAVQHGPDSKHPDPEFIPVWRILRETVRDTKDIPPLLGGALLRAILGGGPYPNALAAALIRRIRADRVINYCRAAMLKAWLTRSAHYQGEPPVSLDSERTEPSYRMGRLFAALEKTQEEALPGINATIRDRFFGAASATPGAVMPRLLRTYQHHLAKLNPGAKINRERLIQEIMNGIDKIPKSLSLEEQGAFAIGYYHQRQSFFTRNEAKQGSNE